MLILSKQPSLLQVSAHLLFLYTGHQTHLPISPVGNRTLMSLDPLASLSFLLGPLHELLNYTTFFLHLSLSVFCMKLKV